MIESYESGKSRFIVSGPFDVHMPDYYIIIRDIGWWIQNEFSVIEWIQSEVGLSNWELSGVVLSFKNSRDVSAFLLKWN